MTDSHRSGNWVTMTDTHIRQIRQARGMTLAQVAKRLDTTPATISRWEREPQRVTVPVLRNLASVLRVSVSDLLGIGGAGRTGGGNLVTVSGLADAADKKQQFDAAFIRSLTDQNPETLAVMRVDGDAMEPTLHDGDQTLVDLTHTTVDRAGMFVFQQGDKAAIRRAIPQLGTGQVLIKADNPAYGGGHLTDAGALQPLGRVIWIGKKV